MKTPYVRDLVPNQTIQGTFLVAYKDIRYKKSGDPYITLTLADRTGELDAKMWENASEAAQSFERNDFVQVKGLMQVFQNRPQLTVHKLQPVPESEIDLADYLPASERDRDEMFAELKDWIGGMRNPHLKALLEALFADENTAVAFRTAPAAKTVHHAWIGGLIEHVLSMCQLAKLTAGHYKEVDFDLLLAGVILHDIGKIHELSYERSFQYTDAGKLLGHIHIGTEMVMSQIRQMPGFPPNLRDLLLHLILSHHGSLEFGSPKVPVFAEAMLLHHLDNLDSKMATVRGLLDRDTQVDGLWTSYSPPLERSVLHKERYLNPDAAAPQPPQRAASDTGAVPGTSAGNGSGNRGGGKSGEPGARRPPPSASPFAAKLQNALGKPGDAPGAATPPVPVPEDPVSR